MCIRDRDTGESIIYQIGDCNFLQLNNDNSIVLGSIDEQMKSPNVPNMIVKKHQTLVTQIDQPTLYHLTLEPGNKIILGSDGLWDNIFFKDIKKILIDNSQSDIARDILIEKVDDVLYQNPTQRTPWSESRKFQKMNTQDGPKIDDTTFLVIQTS